MADSTPAFAKVTGLDHGARVTIVDIVLILFSGIVVFARPVMRSGITQLNSIHDFLVFSALALAIAQSICVQLAVNNGLGKHQDSLSHPEFVSYSKVSESVPKAELPITLTRPSQANYAAQILYVLVLACAKLSVTQIIEAIQCQRKVLLATRGVAAVIGLWTITSVFGLAFQCHLPGPWLINPNRCISLPGLYNFIGIMNILTDIALVVLPIPMMWKIQISVEKKAYILGLFAIRLIVPAITIIQLVYFSRYFHSLTDQTWFNVTPWILTQVVMNTSIIAACIPSLRRVMTELRTNQTGLAITENLELFLDGDKVYGTGISKHSASSTRRSKANGSEEDNNKSQLVPYGHNMAGGITSISSVKSGPGSSQERLRPDVITRTLEFSVEEDRISRSSGSGHAM